MVFMETGPDGSFDLCKIFERFSSVYLEHIIMNSENEMNIS